MVDLRRDFWIREIGTGQQVAQRHEIRYDDDDDNDDDDDKSLHSAHRMGLCVLYGFTKKKVTISLHSMN